MENNNNQCQIYIEWFKSAYKQELFQDEYIIIYMP